MKKKNKIIRLLMTKNVHWYKVDEKKFTCYIKDYSFSIVKEHPYFGEDYYFFEAYKHGSPLFHKVEDLKNQLLHELFETVSNLNLDIEYIANDEEIQLCFDAVKEL